MERNDRWSRTLAIAGLALLLVGALDPLEGSVLILVGAGLAAGAAWRARVPGRGFTYWAFASVLVGVALLFGMSALGGVGGNSGRSIWWLLLVVPYPVGWALSLAATIRMLRRRHSVELA